MPHSSARATRPLAPGLFGPALSELSAATPTDLAAGLRAIAETASLTLDRCTATVFVTASAAGLVGWRAEPDVAGSCAVSPLASAPGVYPPPPAGAAGPADGTALEAPIRHGGDEVGLVRCERAEGGPAWSEAEHAFVAALGALATLAVEREALRASAESYRAIFRDGSDGIWVHDLETGAMLDVNRAGCEMFGYSHEEMMRAGHDALLYPGSAYTAERVAEYMALAAAGETPRFEWMGRHRNGSAVWGELTLRRVPFGGRDHILASARDISERKAIEEELRQLNDTLERRVAERTAELAATNVALEEEISDRVGTELALRDSEARYRTLIENTHDIVTITDTGGRIQYQSPQLRRVLGYDPEEMIGRLALDFVHPDDRRAIEVAMAAIVEEVGTTAHSEYRFLHSDGSWRHLETFGRTLLPGSAAAGLVHSTRDITDRKQAEQELQRREEHFRRLIENGNDLIVVLDTDGTTRYASPSAPRIVGWTPEERVGRNALELIHPDDHPVAYRVAEQLIADPSQPVAFQYRFRHRDGRWLVLDAVAKSMRPDSLDEGVVVNARDVTERHAAEQALKKREEHFRRLIENAHDFVEVVDVQGTTQYISPAVRRVLGYAPEELLGTAGALLADPAELAAGRVKLAEAAAAPGTTIHGEFRVRHRDGSVRVLETFARTLAPDSAAEGIVINARDITERKVFEEALREREERFRRLTEHSSDLVQVVDDEGRIEYTGPSVLHMLGYAPAELLGRNALELVHPDDLARVREAVRAVAGSPGTSLSVRHRVRHRDGRWRMFEAFGRTLLPDTVAEGLVINARDITERHAAEEALRQSEEHFRLLIESSSDIVSIVAPDGTIRFESDAMRRLFGYDPEERVGTSAWESIHPDDLPGVQQEFARLFDEPDHTPVVRFRFLARDGEHRPVEAVGKALPDPSQGVVVSIRDTTERLRAEEALRASEERFRRLIENAHDITSILDPDGGLTYMSPSVTGVLGYEAAELEGRSAFEFIHPGDADLVVRELRRVLADPRAVGHAEYRFRHRDGSWRLVEAFARSLRPEGGGDAIVANVRDVTERRRTEEALRQATAAAEHARREAEEANVAKSEFLSRMSHELRTPMNSILGFAQLLADTDLSTSDRKAVQHILTAGEHLLNLINEVLDISSIEAGRQELSLEPVRLGSVVREALALVRPLATTRSVWMAEVVDGAGDCHVRADRQRLTQVMLNLLSNAVKYNQPGGSVRISTELVPDTASGDSVRVRVEDTGRGIPADRSDQLFVPFARLGAEQTAVEGTGLGLALSRRLMTAMGGSLELESSSPEGSVFRIDLQAAQSPIAAALPLPPPTRAPSFHTDAKVKLVYVEENLDNLSLVEAVLAPYPGWSLIPALLGQLGVELAREHEPDLILLDLHLPDVPGEEVLRRLRAEPRTAAVPIVVVSADATPKSIERLLGMGADAYLTKPLNVKLFLSTLERLLAGRARP
jgi:PAS domain S-box-containing protein